MIDELKKAHEEIARLYKLLDDISTLGDVYKPAITPYFKSVDKLLRQMSDGGVTSDGYSLFYAGKKITS